MAQRRLLVLHFPSESPLTSADIEDDIADAIGNPDDDPGAEHIVDGNEIGAAIDIFVGSHDPAAAFALCIPMLQRMGLLDTMIAAHADNASGPFTVIHPPDYDDTFSL